MTKVYLLLLLIILKFSVNAQSISPTCKCASSIYTGTKADTVFHLTKNNYIALCGYRDLGAIKGRILYSEFVLSACGSKKIIKFWDAVTLCDLTVLKDTLFVNTIVDLPVGKGMAYEKVYWLIERIYFKKGRIIRDSIVNKAIPKYTPTQIASVLKLYNKTPDQNSEKTALLMDRLLVAAVSGSKQAKYYLTNFHGKFTQLSGVIFEQYDTDFKMLKEWKKR
jgi:hypothetical protein